IEAEAAPRELAKANLRAQDAALATAEESARAELDQFHNKQTQISSNIKLREERVANLNGLGTHIARPVVLQAETELRDVKQLLTEATVSATQTQNKIEQIAKERAKLADDMRLDLEREIVKLRNEINDTTLSLSASTGILEVVRNAVVTDGDNNGLVYEIVRS